MRIPARPLKDEPPLASAMSMRSGSPDGRGQTDVTRGPHRSLAITSSLGPPSGTNAARPGDPAHAGRHA